MSIFRDLHEDEIELSLFKAKKGTKSLLDKMEEAVAEAKDKEDDDPDYDPNQLSSDEEEEHKGELEAENCLLSKQVVAD